MSSGSPEVAVLQHQVYYQRALQVSAWTVIHWESSRRTCNMQAKSMLAQHCRRMHRGEVPV
jgi:hypothetical protein